MGEWSDITASLGDGLARLPGGTYAVWYPLTDRARAEGFTCMLEAEALPSLAVEMTMDPQAPGMKGCGVVVVNPPWKFDDEARLVLSYLGSVLYRCGAAQGSVRWIVSK
jgi:23S rRNA (adenine2030-N6)-methyltransferase